MATPFETIGIGQLESAVNGIAAAYSSPACAELRRDQFKAFVTQVYAGLETLGREAGADIDALVWDLDTVRQSIDDAFVDAIDAEEAGEPKINHRDQYCTFHVYRGSVVG